MARMGVGGTMARMGVGGTMDTGGRERSVDRRTVLAGVGATGATALAGYSPAPAATPRVAAAGAAAGAGQLVRVTIEVRKNALIDQLHAFLAAPRPAWREHPVVEEFSGPKGLGLPRQLLEAMVLEGDLTRADVEEFVTGLLDGYDNLVVR
ncbi:MAG: hypothetical protein HY332_16570 [Chloroflexi bacterium]|nr:hypothetical protein [Chloroflexota bacterium]